MSDAYTRLMTLDVSPLQDAARSWRTLATACGQARTDHAHQVLGPLHGHWRGESGQAAIEQLQAVETELDAGDVDAVSFATLLETTRTDLEGAQNNLKSAVRDAEDAGLTVDSTGTVRLPAWLAAEARQDPEQYAADTDRWTLVGQEYQTLINAALRDAETADQRACAALNALDPGQLESIYSAHDAAASATAADRALGITTAGIPTGADSQENAAWWKALSPAEQQTYLATDPQLIGQLNGLPATARDQANRLCLDEFLSSNGPGATTDPDHWDTEYNSLIALRDKLDTGLTAPADQQYYLLGLQPGGEDGKAIVAMGNPDTAANTAILVPGTNTNLGNMPGQLDRIGSLYGAAHSQDTGQSLSVISWLGYTPPQESGESEYDLGVAGTGRAEAGGANLRQFVAGTRAAQGSMHSHITVIGHSYGSTTVGAGAADSRHGLGADDIIVVGSPGTTVDQAKDLHLSPQHVFIGAASDDPIISWASNLTLGPDPAQASFGGTRFLTDTHGHSGYWQPGSQSLSNQGRIIVGRPPTTEPLDPEVPPVPRRPWYH